ncbi:endolytic transglycosylase MltG [Ktedonospora formicarum]|uniref:Endolytic murein transglycosylase n=1 Tax=Ktedonospora formicarum TaxID=2778364 RepID=A0A8J3MRS8_9CHLR|nr:endolytic transglycosylase MltG [Ktedonospora formicarum]GHO43903.1 aminodeoxychorismate lyase [Ktedonospora formicarum]
MKQPKRSRAGMISMFLLAVLIFGGALFSWNTFTSVFQPVDTNNQKTVALEIKPGESTAQIADRLQQMGLIRNALAFRLWARIRGLDNQLQAGVYKKLSPNMTIDKIIDQLLNAQPDAVEIVIPEGWRLEQVANAFSKSSPVLPNFKKADFLKYVGSVSAFDSYVKTKYKVSATQKYPILKSIPKGKSMEGFLFPASYQVDVNADAGQSLGLLLTQIETIIKDNNLEELAKQHQMSLYDMVDLASVVERETGQAADRNDIASVYWNRIYRPNDETNGKLDADPTVQYARDSAEDTDTYWKPLETTGGETASDSPYNTYNTAGLPPTPICSPGLASLKSVADPKKTDYYFFVADKHGKSHFAKTYQEFLKVQEQYLDK